MADLWVCRMRLRAGGKREAEIVKLCIYLYSVLIHLSSMAVTREAAISGYGKKVGVPQWKTTPSGKSSEVLFRQKYAPAPA